MKSISFVKIYPHLIAIGIFLLTTVIFCKPALDRDKTLKQPDTMGWQGMSQQSMEYKKEHGHFPLWTNSMFSGMPTYQIAMGGNEKVSAPMAFINEAMSLWLPMPMNFFFLAALFFYMMCVVARVKPWVAIIGGIAYAFATYNPIIIVAGHNTKMMSLAYAPMIFSGIYLLFQRKYLVGFTVTAYFSASFIGQNHLQIVYYTLLIAGVMAIAYLIYCIKTKQIFHALKAFSLAIIAGIIGLACTAIIIFPTYDYAKETMRGGISQLTLKENSGSNKTKNGLDKDYAFKWSMGKMETFTFLVPGLYGGSNGGDEHAISSSKMVQKMSEVGVPEEDAINAANSYSYWGSMSSLSETTSGPAYMGAIICFLFIFGIIYVQGWQKWWLIAASILGIMLGWGSNFMGFNSFMIDHFPFLNKFRAPSMAMVIPQFCIPLLGTLALNELFYSEIDFGKAWTKIKTSFIVTGAVFVVLFGFYLTTDYTGKGDAQIKDNFIQNFSPNTKDEASKQKAIELANTLMASLRTDRQSEAGGDIFRSLFFILLISVTLTLFVKRKIPALAGLSIVLLFTVIDILLIDKRYFNENKFLPTDDIAQEFSPSDADNTILKDPDHKNFRVFNTTSNFTNESTTSYFHNSIGGYHPAKLGLYQDLIEHQIMKGNIQVLNMLNTKYFIVKNNQGQTVAQQNPEAFGNCWLVKGIKFVNSPNEEMLALDSTRLKDTAVVNASFKSSIPNLPQLTADSNASIQLSRRDNDTIFYNSSSAQPEFAVMSEVYYNRGWNAYIDGKKTDYVKTNYLLRGIALPAGKHQIQFIFEPKSYFWGKTISLWSTLIVYLLLLLTLAISFFKTNQAKA